MGTQDIDYQELVEVVTKIPTGDAVLDGDLVIPAGADGIVLFAHGSGSSRHSPRNTSVARVIREAGVGTLLFDLLTREEESVDVFTRHLRFDIELLTSRLIQATNWVSQQEATRELRIGYFGSSTGAAAALMAAAILGPKISAVVSRGGRPDLAGDAALLVTAPTLLIVGERDDPVVELNQEAYSRLRCQKEMRIIPGATHLFEEADTLTQVAHFASEWFKHHLKSQTPRSKAAGGGNSGWR